MDSASSFRDDGFFTQTLAAAAADGSVVDEIADCYIAIFNADGEGEWHESWTPETARKKLFGDTAGDGNRSFVTTWRVAGQVAGFGIVYVDELEKAVQLNDLPPGLQTQDRLDAIRRYLRWIGGSGRLLNYRELGIRKEQRAGLAPVLRLLHDSMEAATVLGPEFSCCWTSRNSRLFSLICGMDVRLIYDFADPGGHVLMGEDVHHAIRRFGTPAKEVAAMIAERIVQLRIR